MTNLDSVLKSREITLPTKVHLVKAILFPVIMCGCESWTIKKTERRRIDAFIFIYLFLDSVCIYLFIFPFIFIRWRLITLQYCSGFTWISHGFTCVPHPDPPSRLPLYPILLGLPSALALSTQSHASNLGWWSVSPLIVYLFQCCSLWTSHPCVLPQSLKVSSVYLCLFFCFAYRVIITIFLNFIYMC